MWVMMSYRSPLFLIVLLLMGSLAPAGEQATTQPSNDSAALELRANQAFNRGEYAIALPLLQKLSKQMVSEPDRQGQVDEQIRVCKKNLAAAPATPAGQPNAAPLTAENRKPHAAPKAGETLTIDIKDLGNFDYDNEKGGNVPRDVAALNGVTIHTHGFMIPMDQAENISEFALVPSLFACCFGQPPQIQHTILVHTPKGKAVGYYPDEIIVEGTLKVDEKKDEGFVVSLFEIDCTSVKPAAK
jgi:hypothetical protein